MAERKIRASLPPKATALVHVAKSRLGLDEESYRAILCRVAGVASSRDLDAAGFKALMEEFGRLGFESDAHARTFGERPGMATPAQIAHMRRLWSAFTDGAGDDLSLGKWLKGRWGVEHPRFLPQADAHRAIGGLHRMVERRRAKSEPTPVASA